MHSRFGVLHLGEVHARTKLERRRHAKRRPRTDYARAVLTGAPSDLYRAPDHVHRDRDRAWARRRNHRAAVSIREHLDQTALRGETHAPEISRPIRGVSTPRETPHTFHSLAAPARCMRSTTVEAGVSPANGANGMSDPPSLMLRRGRHRTRRDRGSRGWTATQLG